MRLTRRLLLVLATVLAASGTLLAPPASADRAFTARFAQMARGDIRIAANTVMTCPSSATCTQARAGTGSSLNNQDFTMTYVDVDADGSTFDSSSANLTLPAGSTVLFAGLYWGADTSAGGSGAGAPDANAKNTVKLKLAGSGTYSTIAASHVDTDAARVTRYQGFADVTSQVQGAGAGTYTVANVQAGTGTDRYGGWALVVAYRDASLAVNWVSVYDGFGSTGFGGGNSSTDVVLSGFQTPPSGTVAANFGMVSYEGELGYTGETATLNGVGLIDALHPSGNYFNSTISRLGSYVTTKSPNYVNQLGFDANVMDVDGFLPSGSNSATVHFASSLDMFLPGVMTLVTDQVATAPAVTTPPAVTGTVQDGQTLTADPGTWSGTAPISYTYQWQRCDASGGNCSNVGGATNATYQLVSGDVGSTFRVVVTATNVVDSASSTSPASGVATPAPPANVSPPTISGTARDGQVLTAANGTWTGTPTISFAYRWQRCDGLGANCANVSGATASTYQLTPADVGSTMRVVVTGTNSVGSAPASSAQTAVVAADPPANTSLPAISGTAQDGRTLTGSNGTWTGTPTISYSYQWRRCDSSGSNCSDIAGATGSAYQLTPADVGSTVRFGVTASNAAGSTPAASAQSAVVAAIPPSNVLPPTVGGSAEDGGTLTASTGTWSGTPTLSYGYQWQRCDALGAGCANVGGATGATYSMGAADVGHTVRVVVTAANAGGSTGAASAVSDVVAARPPVNTSPPPISGTVLDGQTLTAGTGTWTGTAPISFTYQWRVCAASGNECTDIPGATASTYTLGPAEVGHAIRVTVDATNAGGLGSATSSATGSVGAIAPSDTGAPAIAGTPRYGQTLTASTGTWTGTAPVSFSYQWRRCDADGSGCVDIAGATGSTYALTSDDVGKRVRVEVTATNAGGDATVTTQATGVVTGVAPSSSTAPSISGTPQTGHTLTADPGTWAGSGPVSFDYQWRRCDAAGRNCVDIPGATGSTYTLTPDDAGHTVTVAITATNGAGTAVAESPHTPKVSTDPGTHGGGDKEDLGRSIPDSLVSPNRCQRILAGTGFKRQQVSGVGTIRLQVLASAYISPTNPLRVTASAPAGKVRSVAYLLDGRVVAKPRKAPYGLSVSPKLLAKVSKHVLAVRITPRKGRSHRMTLKITTAPCSNVLSGFQWKTSDGTGLRLRVDSRKALRGATFTVPSAMLPKLKDAGKRPVGNAQIYIAGGKKVLFNLKLSKGDRSATLLRAASNAPQIVLTKKGLAVNGLPARVGIIEITLYTRNRTSPNALLPKRRTARIGATVKESGKQVRLTTTIVAQRH